MKAKTLIPRVITQREANEQPDLTPDSYFEKVIKYIPGEILAFYLAFSKLITEDSQSKFLTLFIIALILTPLYKYFGLRDQSKVLDIPWFQIIISTVAYVVWVYALGDFQHINIIDKHDSFFSSIALATFTLITPILEYLFNRKI